MDEVGPPRVGEQVLGRLRDLPPPPAADLRHDRRVRAVFLQQLEQDQPLPDRRGVDDAAQQRQPVSP
ncbi:hypothetical protein GBA65_20655 [Rubrobacter marinus]|uniref:Uncharacterized protein n=1 Tax=Rubrobacter marinus TaxID=2653852 RepID=A0A6G8Q232_9ACTN|nr:hypothetical protein [Rubrobacter marinus]QIN80523.1 hypothetical protein GBA65_20655 [Rubrobacter marinus]